MNDLPAPLQFLASVNRAGLSERDQEAYSHVFETLKSVRYANYDSGDGRKKLRVLTRFLKGEWSVAQAAEALSWDEERVTEEAQEWLHTEHRGEPLSACWVGPADHPWVAQARKVAEEEADRRDALRSRLLLRMKVVGGVLSEKEAGEMAELSLSEWVLFCKAEDEAPAEEDRKYREGWVLNLEGELTVEATEQFVAETINESAPPGDVSFYVGKNTNLGDKRQEMPGGSFRFFLPDGREALTISPTGDFLVHGNPVANDLEVYETFKAICECARIEHDRHATVTTP